MQKSLADINFNEIIHYPNITGYSKSEQPYYCNGFCIKCEKNNVSHSLTTISHGADSNDFKLKYGNQNYGNKEPIMFLFEDPSPSAPKDDTGEFLESNGLKKHIPFYYYYWIDERINSIPKTKLELLNYPRSIPAYILYLQEIYQLDNVYVTNFVKCFSKEKKSKDKQAKDEYDNVLKTCFTNYLSKEIEIFKPKIILSFGGRQFGHLGYYITNSQDFGIDNNILKNYIEDIHYFKLYHPSPGNSTPFEEIVDHNDKILSKILS